MCCKQIENPRYRICSVLKVIETKLKNQPNIKMDLYPQPTSFDIISTAGAVPVKNEKGKLF